MRRLDVIYASNCAVRETRYGWLKWTAQVLEIVLIGEAAVRRKLFALDTAFAWQPDFIHVLGARNGMPNDAAHSMTCCGGNQHCQWKNTIFPRVT